MKARRKRRGMCSMCLVICLLWGILGGSAAAAGTGRISLDGATILFQEANPSYSYTGSPKEPAIIVMSGGTYSTLLMQGTDYTVSYENNVDAGTATVRVTGTGIYTGSAEAEFQIEPRELKSSALTLKFYSKGYDGTSTAEPEIQVNGALLGDSVTAKALSASFDTPYVGTNKQITVSGIQLSGLDSGNYILENSSSLTLTGNDGQITKQTPTVENEIEITKGLDRDLLDYIPDPWKNTTTFSIDGEYQEAAVAMGCRLEGTHLIAGETTGSFVVYAQMQEIDINTDGEAEYSGALHHFTVSIVGKEAQPPVDGGESKEEDQQDPAQQEPASQNPATTQEQTGFALSGPDTVTYGQSIRLTASGGAGSGKVSYWVEPRGQRGSATIDQQGLLTATQAGTVLVYAKKEGDERYKEARANPIEVTIQQARLTITVQDRTVTVGDPLPVLGQKDYVVSGLVSGDVLASEPTLLYSPEPDLTQPGRTAIQAMGAQVPEGGNYNTQITYLPGTLVIQARPTYAITVAAADLGTVTASHQQALPGTEITLTASPDQDCTLEKLTVQGTSGKVPVWEEGEGRYTFVMPEEGVTVTAVFAQEEPEPEPEEPEPEPEPLPFLDVQPWHWYYEDVDYVYRLGLMQGTGASSFSPDGVTTRGMVVTILYRLAGSPNGAGWAPFADVDPDAYYGTPVGWAAWYGIVNGYSAVSFGPDDQITREQLATILYRYGEYEGWDLSAVGATGQFVDWHDSHIWARQALTWAVGEGLLQGKGQGRLDPLGQASRAQVAAMLHRFHARYLAEPAPAETAPF